MSEPYSLAGRAWIPVASASGRRELVRLHDITNPDWVRLATGRPDCDTALAEFLIGLLAVALGPETLRDWHRLYTSPPGATVLDDAFAPLAHALVLDGEGPRFFQDFAALDGGETPVEALFIDAPADHFLTERRMEVLSRAGAAIALLTLQTMAPSGGAGHRTSLRGGGPLTTLVVPCEMPTLWQLLCANIPLGLKVSGAEASRAFPWLAPTRTSNPKDRGVETTPQDVAETQASFGMPRRIRLTFEPNTERRPCDLTGVIDDVVVRSYVTRPWGANYPSHTWRHPLSPYYKAKKGDAEMLPVHLKSSRVAYKDWLGLVTVGDKDKLQIAARVVKDFRDERARLLRRDDQEHVRFRLLACGYALDNMKPLDFGEALLPLFTAGAENANAALDRIARGMIEAAEEAGKQLAGSVKRALYGDREKVAYDSTVLTNAKDRFWSETESRFYDRLGEATRSVAVSGDDIDDATSKAQAEGWLRDMRDVALRIFDELAPLDDSDARRIEDVIAGRRQLSLMFMGFGPGASSLYAALGLALPEKSANAGKGKKPRKAKT